MEHTFTNYQNTYNTMKRIVFVSLFFALAVSIFAAKDTLRVDKAIMWEPVVVFGTYSTDSLNMKGQKHDAGYLLSKNPVLWGDPQRSISYGAAMPTSEGTISQYQFTIRANRYVKASIFVSGIKNYKLYDPDNKEISTGALTMIPGEKVVRLVALAQKECADTFRVSVVADSVYSRCVSVNDERQRRYTWDDMTLGPQYGTPRLSPSGRYLLQAYYNTRRDGQWDQWAVLTDLRKSVIMRRFEGSVQFKWLPDRDLLYYTRTRDGRTQLLTLNPLTQEESLLCEDLPSGNYTLSPNQDYIIYSTNEDGRDSNGTLKFLEEPDDRMPGWRNRSSLWRLDLRTGLRQRLTFGSVSVGLCDISSDGKRLLLATSRFDATRRPFNSTSILEMDAYTGKVDTILLNEDFLSGEVKYLPDNRRLILNGTCNAFHNVGSELAAGKIGNGFHHCIFLYDMDTRKASYPMPAGFWADITGIIISPIDNAAYLSGEEGYDRGLWRMDLKDYSVAKVNIPLSYISRFSIATQQRNPCIVANGQHLGMYARRCYIGNVGGKFTSYGEIEPKDVNKGIQMAECKTWNFQSSRGDSIRCFYYNLDDGSVSKPMIVYYYGGCSPTPRIVEMLYPFQVWAAQGYTVLVVEPSGASGLGQEFGSRHVGTWGEGTAQDIIEATQQFCHEHSWIDASKIGCIGASYGGFMTQYLQTQTDIFAAAISHAGISNIASYWGGGYWGYSYGEVAEYGQFPWSNRDLFVEHSPLFNADKIHTPLLLLHGTVDTNVPTNESQQLFTALKILGREVSYVTIKDEDHVVSDFKKRAEWARTIQAWFAKYLKGQPEWWEDLYPASKK